MEKLWILFSLFVNFHLGNGGYLNVALNKPAKQSSNHGYGSLGPGGAVDGVVTTVWPNTISTEANKPNAWWKVDLQTDIQDGLVEIYFRTDFIKRRHGVRVYTSTTQFSSGPRSSQDQPCHTITDKADGTDIPDVVSVRCPGRWRYLMVYTVTNSDGKGPILDFGEVKVIVCDPYTYGSNCSTPCTDRHCLNSAASCQPQNGACTCQPGWKGPDCTKDCDSGTYGPNCRLSCKDRHCENSSSSCFPQNGACNCQSGWKGPDCTEDG